MHIGIYFYPSDRSGGRRYLEGLLQSLPEIGPQHDYSVYWEGALRPHLHNGYLFRYHHLPEATSSTWERIQRDLPQRLRRDRIDLFHSHFSRFPIGASCRTVVTLHDAIPALSPQRTLPPTKRCRVSHLYRLALQLADHLIVSSIHTEQLLIQKLRIPARRITRIYPGCPVKPCPVSWAQARGFLRRRFRITRPFLLSVGPLIPRKNHLLLIQAFRKRLWRDCDLVITGALWWRWGYRVLRAIGTDPTIHYLGPVSDRELLKLYAAATSFIYPSQEEGFGFPPLEAMACGTPVVASRSSSIPEVVGDAGLLVKPGSVGELAEAMERAVEDAQLREDLRQRGFKRARAFRWEETAKKTLAVYERVMKEPSYQGTR